MSTRLTELSRITLTLPDFIIRYRVGREIRYRRAAAVIVHVRMSTSRSEAVVSSPESMASIRASVAGFAVQSFMIRSFAVTVAWSFLPPSGFVRRTPCGRYETQFRSAEDIVDRDPRPALLNPLFKAEGKRGNFVA